MAGSGTYAIRKSSGRGKKKLPTMFDNGRHTPLSEMGTAKWRAAHYGTVAEFSVLIAVQWGIGDNSLIELAAPDDMLIS
jgi:hypothetical protein